MRKIVFGLATALCLFLFLTEGFCVGAPDDWVDDKPPLHQAVARDVTPRDGCPNDCSAHGRCLSSGQCACSPGWTGDDCSVSDIAVSLGATQVGHVAQGQWQYYHVAITDTHSTLHFLVNQTSATAQDCDLYVDLNTYPTRYSYYARDISTNLYVDLPIASPTAGTWFVGIYGYTACDYRFEALQASACPKGCANHGTCLTNGSCACYAGWMGADCSLHVTSLTSGTTLSGQSVAASTWNYYSISVGANINALSFIVSQLTAADDCDLYIRRDTLPTFWSWDGRNEETSQVFSVNFTNPTAGVYYAGVYGFSTCQYSILAISGLSCPNNCSSASHGSCVGSGCACQNGYSGSMCEQATFQMVNLVRYTGYVGQGNWNYYSGTALTQQNVMINVQTPSGGDCDLYVKRGTNPTRTDYDYRDVSLSANVTMVIQNPSDQVWKIGIFGYTNCNYVLTGTITYACPNGCSGHGACGSNGHCTCDAGWTGNDCASAIVPLATNGVSITGSIGPGLWKYYTITGIQTAVTVHLLELQGASGFLWLFASDSGAPDLVDYDFNSVDTNTNNHNFIIARRRANDPTSYTIGVYGNPLIPNGHTVPFSLAAFATPF